MTASCPACGSTSTDEFRRFTAADAADHLIPPRRSAARNEALREALEGFWGRGGVGMRRCNACGFGFASPFRAADASIYNLFGGGRQHYPRDRFEFAVTADALRSRGGVERLLEVGAGSGSFLRQLQRAGVASCITATEYDDSAVAALQQIEGLTVVQGDFRRRLSDIQPVDAICLFQVLEHLDDVEATFGGFRALLRPGGEVYIGVPNVERTDVQERLTQFMDMPPVHIGRWTREAVAAAAARHGLRLMDDRTSSRPAIAELYKLATYKTEHRVRSRSGAAGLLERIPYRPVRGAAKRLATLRDVVALQRHYGQVPPKTRWFRLALDPVAGAS